MGIVGLETKSVQEGDFSGRTLLAWDDSNGDFLKPESHSASQQ